MTKEAQSIGDLLPGTKNAIKSANKTKRLLPRDKYDELFKKHSNIVLQEYTKDYSKTHEYESNDDNRDVVELIAKYFTQDPEYNAAGIITNEPSLNKGLLIFGDYGVGKSLLFEIIHAVGRELMVDYRYSGLWFRCVSAGSFVEHYMAEVVKKEKNALTNFDIRDYYKGQLYIDDLGFEKKAFNRDELFSKLLFERNRAKSKTFITTNLTPSEISERYGERIGDRLFEMFNLIKWKGESFRQ